MKIGLKSQIDLGLFILIFLPVNRVKLTNSNAMFLFKETGVHVSVL
jgi:hypothetical protein